MLSSFAKLKIRTPKVLKPPRPGSRPLPGWAQLPFPRGDRGGTTPSSHPMGKEGETPRRPPPPPPPRPRPQGRPLHLLLRSARRPAPPRRGHPPRPAIPPPPRTPARGTPPRNRCKPPPPHIRRPPPPHP